MGPGKRITFVLFAIVGLLAGLYTVSAHEPKSGKKEPFDEEAALQAIQKTIAGRENEPAEKVFRNVQVLKQVPAGRLLRVMDDGFSHSLGVDCTFCHDPQDWSSDEKGHKRIARQMAVMTQEINNRLIPAVTELKDPKPPVSCFTCHRGEPEPKSRPEEKEKGGEHQH